MARLQPDAITAAIKLAGGYQAVADRLNKPRPTVNNWVGRRRIPAEYVIPIAEMTGGLIKAQDILEVMTRYAGIERGAS